MIKIFFNYFIQGFLFAKNNPQILYTIFLLIVIPIAFIVSGREFLSAAKSNQERLEKERVGVMQDIFVELASSKMEEPLLLQESIDRIKAQNEQSISGFKVLSYDGGERTIIASLNKNEIGTVEKDSDFTRIIYDTVGARGGGDVKIFPLFINGERYWRSVQAISDPLTKMTIGISLIDVSMVAIDEVSAQNVERAYIFLFFIVLAISLLLLRQARIVDYTVLYRKLKEVDQMKDDFISMAAHELRTPLAIVKGYAEMLSRSKNLKEEDKSDVSRITVSIEQLNVLIGDILDVIRLGQGKMVFKQENVDIAPILENIIESFQYVAHKKGLQVFYEKKGPIFAFVDGEKFRQVIVNIVGNSIKYTPSGSVTVFVEGSNSIVSVRVRDTGIGISAEDQQKLFQKFFRVQNKETEDIRGTGLGLWIAAQVVSNMNGKISVESIKGKGPDLIISFPAIK